MSGAMNPKVHEFRERLTYSEQASDEPFWQRVYRQAFPTMISCAMASGDTVSQRNGIDRVIVLASGQILRIDEKKRERTYNDILLEYVSRDTTGAPGWIEKDLTIEYLAYAFMDTRKVYLLDWHALRRAWKRNGNAWKQRYGSRKAVNRTYNTLSCPVPIAVLLNAMQEANLIVIS